MTRQTARLSPVLRACLGAMLGAWTAVIAVWLDLGGLARVIAESANPVVLRLAAFAVSMGLGAALVSALALLRASGDDPGDGGGGRRQLAPVRVRARR